MEKKWIVAIALVVVFAVGLSAYSLGVKGDKEKTSWIRKSENVKKVSFELGVNIGFPTNEGESKNIQFFLPTSSAWREMEFSVDMQSSGDVDVVLWQYEDEGWNKERKWKGVSSLNQSFSYYDGGNMRLEIVNDSTSLLNSKNVSVEITRSWEEKSA